MNTEIDEATVETLHDKTGKSICVKTNNGEQKGILIDLSSTTITLKKVIGKARKKISFENISQITTDGIISSILYEN